jgi:hypothetical protein
MAASGDSMCHADVSSHHADIILPCHLLTSEVRMMMWPPVHLPCLTATLTTNIFQTVTLFDKSFAPLEILQRTLHDHFVFTDFWGL